MHSRPNSSIIKMPHKATQANTTQHTRSSKVNKTTDRPFHKPPHRSTGCLLSSGLICAIMPSLEQLLLSAPAGFVRGCSFINEKARNYDTFLSLTTDIFSAVTKGEVSTAMDNMSISSSSSDAVTTLKFIARCCNLAVIPNEDLPSVAKPLSTYTNLSDDAVKGLVAALENTRLLKTNKSQSNHHLGRLFDLKWKLGVAVSSSVCSNLTSPYVALSYKICDSNGNIQGYAMELTYPEFQEFLTKLKGIAEHMDSL